MVTPYHYHPNLMSLVNLTEDQFYDLCQANPDVKFERSPGGTLLIMPPTGGETGNRNIEVGADLVIWNRQAKLGVLFDCFCCFNITRPHSTPTVVEYSNSTIRPAAIASLRPSRSLLACRPPA
ncbi:MAG: Uma2 family endonuclease [Cyanobacteria bacterium J06628_6]